MTAPSVAPREGERGIILVNVLMFVAIAAGLVLLMITREEDALDRATRLREVARALAVVRGGELSAIAALRRDQAEAPDADYPGEAWGTVAQNEVAIDGGRFSLAIADAQGRFNINSLRDYQSGTVDLWQRIGTAAGLSPEQIIAATAFVRAQGPVVDLRPLEAAGIDAEVAARLRGMVTALPGTGRINLNSAPEPLLAVLVEDPEKAAALAALRQRNGRLTRADLVEADVFVPGSVGFTSDAYWVRTRAVIGDTAQQGAALVLRRLGADGRTPETVAVERWRNAAIPPDAPPLPGGR